MGPDDPEDTNPDGLDVDAVEDDSGRTRYVVLDEHGIAELADEIEGLSPAAQQRAAVEGFDAPRFAAPGGPVAQDEDPA